MPLELSEVLPHLPRETQNSMWIPKKYTIKSAESLTRLMFPSPLPHLMVGCRGWRQTPAALGFTASGVPASVLGHKELLLITYITNVWL